MWEVAELAYFAGLLDGEGNIGIYRNPPRVNWHQGSDWFIAQVTITNTDSRVIDWCSQHFGGRVCLQRKAKGNQRTRWGWMMNNLEMDNVIPAIRPYLIIKGERADVLMEFRATYPLGRKGVGGKLKDPEIIRQRIVLQEKMSYLNQLGADAPLGVALPRLPQADRASGVHRILSVDTARSL